MGTPTTPQREYPALMPLPASLRARPAPPHGWAAAAGRDEALKGNRRDVAALARVKARVAAPGHSTACGVAPESTTQIHTVARGMARREAMRMRA